MLRNVKPCATVQMDVSGKVQTIKVNSTVHDSLTSPVMFRMSLHFVTKVTRSCTREATCWIPCPSSSRNPCTWLIKEEATAKLVCEIHAQTGVQFGPLIKDSPNLSQSIINRKIDLALIPKSCILIICGEVRIISSHRAFNLCFTRSNNSCVEVYL